MDDQRINKGCREPNELEAWKLMMDSMVKFITASTKLMNTINSKAGKSLVALPQTCEPECPSHLNSVPKKKSGSCAAMASLQAIKRSSVQPVIPEDKSEATQSQTVQDTTTNTNIETQESATAPEATPNPVEEIPPEKTDPPPESTNEAPQEGEAPMEDALVEVPPADTQIESAAPEPMVDVSKSGDCDQSVCVCAEVRKIKKVATDAGVNSENEGKSKGKCGCAGKKDGLKKPQLCACPVSSNEKSMISDELMEKLNKAEQEINALRQELLRLQMLDATRKSPSAALYKEIMKDTYQNKKPSPRLTPRVPASQQHTSFSTDVSYKSPQMTEDTFNRTYLSIPEYSSTGTNDFSQNSSWNRAGTPTRTPQVAMNRAFIGDSGAYNRPGAATPAPEYCVCPPSELSSKSPRSYMATYQSSQQPQFSSISQPRTSLQNTNTQGYNQNQSNVVKCMYQRPRKKPIPPSTQMKSMVPPLDPFPTNDQFYSLYNGSAPPSPLPHERSNIAQNNFAYSAAIKSPAIPQDTTICTQDNYESSGSSQDDYYQPYGSENNCNDRCQGMLPNFRPQQGTANAKVTTSQNYEVEEDICVDYTCENEECENM